MEHAMKRGPEENRAHQPDQDRQRGKPKRRRFRSPRIQEPDTEGLSEKDAAKLKRFRDAR